MCTVAWSILTKWTARCLWLWELEITAQDHWESGSTFYIASQGSWNHPLQLQGSCTTNHMEMELDHYHIHTGIKNRPIPIFIWVLPCYNGYPFLFWDSSVSVTNLFLKRVCDMGSPVKIPNPASLSLYHFKFQTVDHKWLECSNCSWWWTRMP